MFLKFKYLKSYRVNSLFLTSSIQCYVCGSIMIHVFSCIRHLLFFILMQNEKFISCNIPLHDYIIVHLPILLSMGIWIASSLGTSWSNAALTIIVLVILCWNTPRNATAQSQDICECLALAGTTTEFSKVTTCLALHERISSALDAPFLWQHLMRILRKPLGIMW